MRRVVYLTLLRFHPRSFRERFTAEMTSIFDAELQRGKSSIALFADLVLSLFRQWLFRPANRERALAAAVHAYSDVPPMFRTLQGGMPHRSLLVSGAALALLLLSVVTMTIGRGHVRSVGVLIGSKYPRPPVLSVDRNSIAEGEPTSQITIASPSVDPLYELAAVYFNIVRVLKILDANGDFDISAWEIITSASPLRKLDVNRDGELDALECGLIINADLPPDVAERAPSEFMQLNPVLATLDADHNGIISAEEIGDGSATLRLLDRNGDGRLTPGEILPERVHTRTAIILSRIDTDRDRKISRLEQDHEEAEPIRAILMRADRNRDGIVTAAELTRQLKFEDEVRAQHERALGSAGYGGTFPERRKSAQSK